MNNAGLISKIYVGIFDDSSFINKKFNEYCWDEQCFLCIVLEVQLHPNFQVQPQCLKNKYSQFVQEST